MINMIIAPINTTSDEYNIESRFPSSCLNFNISFFNKSSCTNPTLNKYKIHNITQLCMIKIEITTTESDNDMQNHRTSMMMTSNEMNINTN